MPASEIPRVLRVDVYYFYLIHTLDITESMTSEDVRRRELAPLQKIADNYEKIVLSLDPGLDSSYDGIKSLKGNVVKTILFGVHISLRMCVTCQFLRNYLL